MHRFTEALEPGISGAEVIWESLLETVTRNGSLGMGLGMVSAYGDDDVDATIKQAARDTANEGVQRAASAVCEQRHRWAEHARIIEGAV